MKKKVIITLGSVVGVGATATMGTVLALSHKMGANNLENKYIIENAFETPLSKNEILGKIGHLSKDNINVVLTKAGLGQIIEKDGYQVESQKFSNIEDAKKVLNDKYSKQIQEIIINQGHFPNGKEIANELRLNSVNTYYVYNHKVYNTLEAAQNAWIAANPGISKQPGMISIKIPILNNLLKYMPWDKNGYSNAEIFKLFNWTKAHKVVAPALEEEFGIVNIATNKGHVHGGPTNFKSKIFYNDNENAKIAPENFQTLREPDNAVDFNLNKVYDFNGHFGIQKKLFINSKFNPSIVVKETSTRQPVIWIGGRITNIPYSSIKDWSKLPEDVINRQIYNPDGTFKSIELNSVAEKEKLYDELIKNHFLDVNTGTNRPDDSSYYLNKNYLLNTDNGWKNSGIIENFTDKFTKSQIIDKILHDDDCLINGKSQIQITLGHEMIDSEATYDFYLSDGHGVEKMIDRRFTSQANADVYKAKLEGILPTIQRMYRSVVLGRGIENINNVVSISMETTQAQPAIFISGREINNIFNLPFGEEIYNLDGTLKNIWTDEKKRTLFSKLEKVGVLHWKTTHVEADTNNEFALLGFTNFGKMYRNSFVYQFNGHTVILENADIGGSTYHPNPILMINRLINKHIAVLKDKTTSGNNYKHTYYINYNDGTRKAIDVKFIHQNDADIYLNQLKTKLKEARDYKHRGIRGIYSFTFQDMKYLIDGPKNFEAVTIDDIKINLSVENKDPRREYIHLNSAVGQIIGNPNMLTDRWIEPDTQLLATNLQQVVDADIPSTKQKYSFVFMNKTFYIIVDKNTNFTLNDLNIKVIVSREYVPEKYDYYWQFKIRDRLFYETKTTMNSLNHPVLFEDDLHIDWMNLPTLGHQNTIKDVPDNVIGKIYSKNIIGDGRLESTMDARDDRSATQGFEFDGRFYTNKDLALAAANTKTQHEVDNSIAKMIMYNNVIYYNWENAINAAKIDLKNNMKKIEGKYTYNPDNFI